MSSHDYSLATALGLAELIPADMEPGRRARVRTLFLKKLSLAFHQQYGGVIQTTPRAPLPSSEWLDVWYTPGVSAVSTAIRDVVRREGPAAETRSFELTSRGNTVAVVSDSTRVLGDGDCTPSGGLGVMEGKAFLMKYLGGVDAVPLCIDSRLGASEPDPENLIRFVKMVQHSFGAVNLEDISQPNCFRVLDELQDCVIPVWHDDAQGTAAVTLAGLLNALKIVGKELSRVRIVLLGAGAANTTIARFILADGGDPERLILADKDGCLHTGRRDLEADPRAYRQWELAKRTNPQRLSDAREAIRDADVLIALSAPGPGTVKPEWVASMARSAIVFACANPVPEIWPHEAREAGAAVVATGRGDFPNQVNNSVCFPGLLKGVLLARARRVSDGMAISAAHCLADFAEKRGIGPEDIMPRMEEAEVFAREAAAVATTAVSEGLAREQIEAEEVYRRALEDAAAAKALYRRMQEEGFIPAPDPALLRQALDEALAEA